MGLGKTCQAVSLLLYVSGALRNKGPFLVLSPLSVLENWRKEFKFAPSLKVLCYKGDKARRAELQKEMDSQRFDVLLTTYELCLKDASFLRRFTWAVLVVDEAHRLKNQFSKLHQSLKAFSVKFRLLLTGTPIQNNLQELYSLLNFIQPTTFKADNTDNFITSYCNLQHQPALAAELQERLEPFLLRRVKGEVDIEVPNKMELVIYHGMTALQKKYYKAALMKDLEAFQNDHGHKNRLLNILINLRKCVNHPYLFDGVEPEPFEMGEHLIEASGKLSLLNNILGVLHKKGHRVLLFSQMTRMLDIVEDYMEYKDYSYERLDGSFRGEDRDRAVKNFSNSDIFAFLLSTKAGGVGLNLTAADTVVFIDSDFNPHNDLQAAARCHRIGQNRPVKIIRLIGRDTVEEIMYCRAVSKLNLTKTVIEDGRFSLLEQAESASAGLQLSEILTFGLDKLLSSEQSSVQKLNLEKILGPSRDGQWVDEDLTRRLSSSSEEEECSSSGQNHLYYFEGKDYSKVPSAADKVLFQMVMKEWMAEFLESKGSRTLRQRTVVSVVFILSTLLLLPLFDRVNFPFVSPFVVHSLTIKNPKKRKYVESQERDEPTAKRRNVQKKINNKKMACWESCGYRTQSLPPADSEAEAEAEAEERLGNVGSTELGIHYVLGDVTHPHSTEGDAIIIHCVAMQICTGLYYYRQRGHKYCFGNLCWDLDVGNVLFFPIDDKQSRSDGQDHVSRSGIHLSALDKGLKTINVASKESETQAHNPECVDLPVQSVNRETASCECASPSDRTPTKGFNWRVIRKHLASRGIPTFMYLCYLSAKDSESCCFLKGAGLILTQLADTITAGRQNTPGNHLGIATHAELKQRE
ncbi:hypothetical protein fugu_005802 [Takifugu bimaculatus]|uniref:Helicase ATP-binding domain-containing protein n=1 Tax=Takifugu bimaculatus TaxID=433685 RepID=A0A4Z2B5D7_9TELE|nr:hypothetical protein fugu_005802 [Takifugu bimaculatus]